MSCKTLEYEPLIKDGSYSVVLHDYKFRDSFGKPRLLLYFKLAEISEYKNCIFTKWFNVLYFVKSKNGKYKFKVSKKTDFPKFWKLVFPSQSIKRFDRFALNNLKGIVLQAKITASDRDYQQKVIDKDFRVSKIVSLKP